MSKFGKSEMVLVGEMENVFEQADLLNSKVGSLPMTYLGMLLGVSFKSTGIWNGILFCRNLNVI